LTMPLIIFTEACYQIQGLRPGARAIWPLPWWTPLK
jgi:hypothetical protein